MFSECDCLIRVDCDGSTAMYLLDCFFQMARLGDGSENNQGRWD